MENDEMLFLKRRIRRKIENRASWFNSTQCNETGKYMCSALEYAYGLGRADAENKKMSVWIHELEDDIWAMKQTCSCCGYNETTDVHVELGYKFCPGCGAPIANFETVSHGTEEVRDYI